MIGPFSFVEVLVESSEEIVALLFLDAVGASRRKVEPIKILIAVLKTVFCTALAAGKHFARL